MTDFAGGGVTTRAGAIDLAGSNYLLAYEETAADRTLSFAPIPEIDRCNI
jgi:hypothetical protein